VRIVSDSLKLLTDSVIMVAQRGFMTDRGCVDQVFAVMQVIEKVTEKDKVAYADLEITYESVSRDMLWGC